MSTGVYYNDSEPFVCDWLENLIREKLLPAGVVDRRPIQEVEPNDVRDFAQCHFFAGIGGWAYALQLAGWGDRPVWTGSCPCQPFSAAGKGQAEDDPRHLWPSWFRLIRECRPERVFGEQVANAAGHGWLDVVSTDLEAEAYRVGAVILGAHSIGAPHRRQRIFWVADPERWRLESRDFECAGAQPVQFAAFGGAGGRHPGWRAEDGQPRLGFVADGFPTDLGEALSRAIGNAIVPRSAAEFVSAYLAVQSNQPVSGGASGREPGTPSLSVAPEGRKETP